MEAAPVETPKVRRTTALITSRIDTIRKGDHGTNPGLRRFPIRCNPIKIWTRNTKMKRDFQARISMKCITAVSKGCGKRVET